MKKVEIKLPGNSYPVIFGRGNFQSIYSIIDGGKGYSRILIIADKNVFEIYSASIKKLHEQFRGRSVILIFSSKESNKSLRMIQKIYDVMQKNSFGRDSLIISVGGGITGDTAGFAAASYMRGIDFIQVPTTLLAAVDSSVGGKTGVNFSGVKNIIGAFHQPRLVLIDTSFIDTLPGEELLCGLGEASKNAFLIDRGYYDFFRNSSQLLLERNSAALEKLIYESVKFKAGVVTTDERETGLRKILNLGHTFAHAIETEQNFKIKHGQAVIAGLTCSLYLSEKLGVIDKSDLEKFLEIPLRFREFIRIRKFRPENLYPLMLKDKKNRGGNVKFVLVKDIGKILIDVEASKKEIVYALSKGLSHFSK